MIQVKNLCRDFAYYEKAQGIKGSAKNLFKRTKKSKRVVDNLSFDVKKGEIVGFLGANGAGKTTTMKMLSGILFPTSGSIYINGYIPWERKDEFKKMFTFISGQKTQLWQDLPAIDTFYLNKCIYDIPDDEFKNTLDNLTELFDVQELINVQVRRLSLGEKMKMQIIASLLHRPKIVFLDEPTIGLDLTTQIKIRNFFKDYAKNEGVTIILTSHYMKDIEELCKRTIIIDKGKLIYSGLLSDIKKRFDQKKMIKLELKENIDRKTLSQYGKIIETNNLEVTIELDSKNYIDKISTIIKNLPVAEFSIEEISIEQGVLMLMNGKAN